MSKGKKAIQIDKIELQKVVDDLETANVFKNRSELWLAVQNTDFAKNCKPRPLSYQVAMILAQKFGIEPKTPKGKKGRSPGEGIPAEMRNAPKKSRQLQPATIQALENIIPIDKKQSYQNLLNKAGTGSLKALVQLKCLDCSNYQKQEVKLCPVNNCPLHAVRPYQS